VNEPRFVLSTDRLTKVFAPVSGPSAIAAVQDVTLDVGDNEIVGIVGPNGAGKTTLIDILAGTIAPTSGSFTIGGGRSSTEADVRARIGYGPSGGRSLYPRLTAVQNIRFFSALYGMCPHEATTRAAAALRLVGALDVQHVRVDRLSDGMVGRVSLARALVHDPALLLLDEPMRSIDPVRRPAVLRVVRDYADQPGKAVVMVTHDLDDVFAICDRVATMRDGKIIAVLKVASVRHDRDALARAVEGAAS
jgi:ABC-2 type transport system ATP-binding protein